MQMAVLKQCWMILAATFSAITPVVTTTMDSVADVQQAVLIVTPVLKSAQWPTAAITACAMMM